MLRICHYRHRTRPSKVLHTIGGHDYPWMVYFCPWIQGLYTDGREFHRRRHTSRRDFYYQRQTLSIDNAPPLWITGISIVFCSSFSDYLTLLILLTLFILLLLLNYYNYLVLLHPLSTPII